MITCTSCGQNNPMGTRWCRQCGAKLNLDVQQVTQAIAETAAANTDATLLERGRSLAMLGVFLLLAVALVRWALVPQLPPAAPTVALAKNLLPETEAAAPPAPAANGAITSARLRWRAAVCRTIGNGLGLDLAALDRAREALIASQQTGQTWAGDDQLAATALNTLALQAWPTPGSLAAAAGSRTWLAQQLRDPTRRTSLGRILALCALADAEELSAPERDRLQAYLIDGKQPQWQTWLLSGLPGAAQPAQLGLLRAAEMDELWRWQLALATGTRPNLQTSRFFTEAAGSIVAEDRPAWAFLAWHLTPAPADSAKILAAWSREPVPAVGPALAKAGPTAANAIWLLTVAAPVRLPALTTGLATP